MTDELTLIHADGTILVGTRGNFHGEATITTDRGTRYERIYEEMGFTITDGATS